MKIAAAVGAAALVVLAISGCSSTDDGNVQDKLNDAMTSGRQVVESAKQSAGSAIEQGKVALFVATFRGAYSPLSENRDDADIAAILTSTCAEIAAGTDADTVKTKVAELAANGGLTPTATQADHIYQLAKGTCP